MEDKRKTNYDYFQLILLYFGMISTVLIYSPNSTLANVFTYVMYASWVCLFILLIFNGNGNGINNMMLWLLAVYVAFFLMGKVLYQFGLYLTDGAGIGGTLTKCVFFYFIGYNFKEFPRKKIIFAYCVACTALAANLYLVLAQGGYWEIKDKNQFGFMLTIAVLSEFLYLLKSKSSFFYKLIIWGMLIFTIIVCIRLHSRTPIFALIFAGLLYFFSQKRSFREYVILALILVCAIVYFCTSAGREILFSFLQGDQRSSTLTANSISSGRTALFKEALNDFWHNPIFGVGAWANVDSMPLAVLRTSGLVGAIFIFPLGYGRTISTIRDLNSNEILKEDSFSKMFIMITITTLFASLMEGGLPFGPGTQMFYYWILFGHIDDIRFHKKAD